MKMRKLLASGVAATMAVTSLATAASAAEKTWDMGTSQATENGTWSIAGDINPELGGSAIQTKMQKVKFEAGGKIVAYKDDTGRYAIQTYTDLGGEWVDGSYVADWAEGTLYKQKKDNVECNMATAKVVAEGLQQNAWYSSPKLTVSGYKIDEKGNRVAVTKEYTMTTEYAGGSGSGTTFSIVVLQDDEAVYRDGEFAPLYFDIIETVKVTGEMRTEGIKDQEMYNALEACKDVYEIELGDAIVGDWDPTKAEDWQKFTEVDRYIKDYTANKANLLAETENNAAEILAYAFAHGGYKVSEGKWLEGQYTYSTALGTKYPFISEKYTTVDGARVIKRTDVQLLSDTDAHASEGATANDGNQSYVGEDTTQGTDPRDFAGFASQFAEFFNKQTNGTVTFKFTTSSGSSSGNNWVTGGIPSTETGIKNALNGASANDFGFFVNYRTTGSLQAVTSIDAAAGTVSFDVSDILDAMGGQTIGVVNDIWFGLAKGIEYDADHKGLYVESITFAYDEDGDVDADIEEEDDVEVEDDVDVEEDDDVEIEDDATEDDDVAIEDDTTEDDDAEGDAEGDVIVETEDDDANPGTGVALAVVPALVAAAAVVVSKKRS